MTLFSRGDDPLSHRVRIVVAVKSLEVRVVEVDPARPPEDLIDLNPYQAVPTLVDRDLVIYGAGIICEYLDERFPAPSLMPVDPGARAQARLALHRIEQDWYSLVPELESGERREQLRPRRALQESMLTAEALFRVRPWFLSDHFSQLDAAVAPILWRLPVFGIELKGNVQPIRRYMDLVFSRRSFRDSLSDAEQEMRQ